MCISFLGRMLVVLDRVYHHTNLAKPFIHMGGKMHCEGSVLWSEDTTEFEPGSLDMEMSNQSTRPAA